MHYQAFGLPIHPLSKRCVHKNNPFSYIFVKTLKWVHLLKVCQVCSFPYKRMYRWFTKNFCCMRDIRLNQYKHRRYGPEQLSRYSDSLRSGRSGNRIVQTGPGAHRATYAMGARYFPGVNRLGRGVDHPPRSSAEVKKEYSYTSTPSQGFVACFRVDFAFNL